MNDLNDNKDKEIDIGSSLEKTTKEVEQLADIITTNNLTSLISEQSKVAKRPDSGEISHAERINILEEQIIMLRSLLDSNAGKVPVPVRKDGQLSDGMVQVPLRDYVIGLARCVGYAHSARMRSKPKSVSE